MNKKIKQKPLMHNGLDRYKDFHAGHFLRELLLEQGYDVSWLAARTDSDMEALEILLEQPNMDAELFVRIGLPLQPLFMQRVEEMIFGKQPAEVLD